MASVGENSAVPARTYLAQLGSSGPRRLLYCSAALTLGATTVVEGWRVAGAGLRPTPTSACLWLAEKLLAGISCCRHASECVASWSAAQQCVNCVDCALCWPPISVGMLVVGNGWRVQV